MKVKIIKSAIVLSSYSFLNIVFIVFLVSSSLSFASPQDKPKVNICEFSCDSLNKRDLTLKKRIQEKITKKLRQSKEIEKVEFIKTVKLPTLGNIEEYCKRQNIRYIIDGIIEDISEVSKDQMRMTIVVKDMDIKEDNKKKWSIERALEKDLDTTEYWFDKVSEYICSVIEGVSIREAVFVYCFRIIGDKYEKTQKIKLRMPTELHTRLEDKDFGQKYILETFQTKGAKIDECEKGILDTDRNFYEYIIEGEIELDYETNKCEVTVEVFTINKKKPDILVQGFRQEYTGGKFFDDLAERIMKEWAQKFNK